MANSISIGVAYKDAAIVGGSVDNSPVGATTASTGAFTTLTSSGNTGFSGAAASAPATFVAQLSTSAGITGRIGFTGSQAAEILSGINALLTMAIAKGLMASS